MPLVQVGVHRTSISGTGGKFASQVLARYSVVLVLLGFGVASSPLGRPCIRSSSAVLPILALQLFDQQTASNIIGPAEIGPGAVIAAATNCAAPVIGSYGVAASLVVTLSFLMTTPHLDLAFSSFIIKNVCSA
jgi:hypothetical protein